VGTVLACFEHIANVIVFLSVGRIASRLLAGPNVTYIRGLPVKPLTLCVASVAAGLLLCLVACTSEKTEVFRATLPGDAVSAVVVREDAGGAAGSRAYFVYLQSADRNVRLESPVVSATRCESLQLVWRDTSTLEVRYSAGCRIFGFKIYWYDAAARSRDNSTDPAIEVVLIRTERDEPARNRH
jgi:hypothetical protein